MKPIVILAIGWCAFVLYAYPGIMAADSYAAFAGDSSPPLYAWIWSVLDYIVAGPFGMLAVQSIAFLAGAYLIAERIVPPRAAAICACIALLAPPTLPIMAVMWPHALFAGLALLGAGLVLRGARIAGAVALAVAAVMLATSYALGDGHATIAGTLGWEGDVAVQRHDTQNKALLDKVEIASGTSWLQVVLADIVDAFARTFLFRPWFYMLVAAGLIVRRRERVLRVLLASGLALELAAIVVGRDASWRHASWLIACTWLAALVAIASDIRAARARDRVS